MYKRVIIGLFVLLSATFSNAQELLQLDEAVAIALQKNHQIKVNRNTAQISKNNVHLGNAGFLPRVDILSAATYSDLELQSKAGTIREQSTLNSAQIVFSYNLFNGLGGYFTLKNLRAQAEGGKLAARQNIELTIMQVIGAYYNVAAAEEALNIRKDALQISRERLQRINKKAVYGQANKIDLLNAQVDFNADTTAYLSAQLQLTEARRNLNLLLGRDVNTDYSVDTQVTFAAVASQEKLKASAFQNNASYLLAQSQLRQARYALRQVQSSYYPQLSLTSAYGYSQTASDLNLVLDNPNRSLTAGLTLSMNLFNGFQNKIQKQNARIAMNNQHILLERMRLSLEKDLDNAYTAYRNQRFILELEQTNLNAAELNFKRSQELYNLGHLTATDFRAAQLNLIQARYRLSQAKFQAKSAETELLRLSGKLLRVDN